MFNTNTSLVAVKKLESESTDLRFILGQKERNIRELESDLQSLKTNFDSLINKSVKGLDTPLPPKILINGKFSHRDLQSVGQPNHQANEDWANELRIADEKVKSLKLKIGEQLD